MHDAALSATRKPCVLPATSQQAQRSSSGTLSQGPVIHTRRYRRSYKIGGSNALAIHEDETRPDAVPSQAHDRQVAHDAGPLEHEPPAGDAPPGVRFHDGVVVVPVDVRHGADVVGDAERGGHEVRGRVGGGGVVVDVDEEGAELVLVGVVGEGCAQACFDFREAGEVSDGAGAEVGGGGGGEDLVRFWINDEPGEAWLWFEWGPWRLRFGGCVPVKAKRSPWSRLRLRID